MAWTSLFFNVSESNVLILGTGEVATRRANRFLDNGSNVILIGNSIENQLKDKGAILKNYTNIEEDKESLNDLVQWADILVLASGDKILSEYLASISGDKLVNRADKPEKGNIIVPTTFYIEDIEISIFTGGKSPLMAKELRKKIQSLITKEDILEIQLQDYIREILKNNISHQKIRKDILYKIYNDELVKEFLRNNQLDKAKEYVNKLIGELIN